MIQHPLPDGLYWYRDDNGAWAPMLVRDGVQHMLATMTVNGDAQTVSDFACTVAGPLVMPQ